MIAKGIGGISKVTLIKKTDRFPSPIISIWLRIGVDIMEQ